VIAAADRLALSRNLPRKSVPHLQIVAPSWVINSAVLDQFLAASTQVGKILSRHGNYSQVGLPLIYLCKIDAVDERYDLYHTIKSASWITTAAIADLERPTWKRRRAPGRPGKTNQ